jgi:hypothetical protein
MANEVYVSSTTDSQEDVERAAAFGEDVQPLDEETPEQPPEVSPDDEEGEAETPAAQEPAQPDSEEEVEEEPEEAEPEEEAPPEQAARAEGESKRQLRATNARLLARIAELERERGKPAKPEEQEDDLAGFPKYADKQYAGKTTEHVNRDQIRFEIQRDKQESAARQLEMAKDGFREQERIYAQAHPGYWEAAAKVSSNGETPLPPVVIDLLMATPAPASPALVDHLANHTESHARLWSLAQQGEAGIPEIVKQLHSIGMSLQASSNGSSSTPHRSPQPRNPPPPPIRPVRGSVGTVAASQDLYSPDMDYQTHKRIMNQRERGR